MKKTPFTLAAMLFTAAIVAGCVAGCSTPAGTATETPAQIAAKVCPATLGALTSLQSLNGLSAGETKDLGEVTPVVSAVCAAGATVMVDNLTDLATTALPAIVNIVKSSPLSPDDQNKVILDLTAAQIVLDAALAAMPPAAPVPVPTPATST